MSQLKRTKSQFCIAEEIWLEIKDSRQPADRWLGNYFHQNRKRMGSKDRRFFSEIIYSLFRHKIYIQNISKKHFGGNSLAEVILAATLIDFLEVDEAVSIMGEFFKDINYGETREIFEKALPFDGSHVVEDTKSLCSYFSFSEEMVIRWEADHGFERTREVARIFQERPPLIIRANELKITRDELIRELQEINFDVYPCDESPWGIFFKERIAIFNLDLFTDGFFEVQDIGSQLVCLNIDAKPNDVIWDVCAGAGGKSLGLASMMGNKGRIVATDIRSFKLQELKKRAKRAGAFNIFPADLTRMDEMKIARQGFNKILVDAPCSGTGTLKRNPDAKWKLNEERIGEYPSQQIQILKDAWPYLQVGGKMYYVTCSIEKMENEAVLDQFLNSFDNMRLVHLENFGEVTPKGSRLWPSEKNDGFFMACVEKIK